MGYKEGQSQLSPRGQDSSSALLSDLFKRIDENRDQGIDRREVMDHLKRVGVQGGFLGLVYKTAASAFMEKLDTNQDKRVTFNEFKRVAAEVLPKEIFDENGQVKPELVYKVFKQLDRNKDQGIDREELKAGIKRSLPKGTSHKDTAADIGSKLGLDAMDLDKSGAISLEELKKFARAVAALRG